MASLVAHARRELELCGQYQSDPAYAQSIVATVAAFVSYGHSGGSAMVAFEQLTALLQYRVLSPLTDDPQEWEDRCGMSGGPLWQSVRQPEAFSDDGGKTYWLLQEVPKSPSDGKAPRHRSVPRGQAKAVIS